MSYEDFLKSHRDSFSIMSGYDVQTTLGFGRLDDVRRAAERVFRLFRDGGALFCTTHLVQHQCSIDELTYAFDLIHNLVREGMQTRSTP
jgi:uroporphyrinogen decarboxylase